jgi:hypothetical protein
MRQSKRMRRIMREQWGHFLPSTLKRGRSGSARWCSGAGSRMHTHGVCFDATPRVNRDRIVQSGVIVAVTADGMRVAVATCVTRIDRVLATR